MPHFAAPARFLITPEGQGGVEYVVAVDPDRSGAKGRGCAVRFGDVFCPNTGCQSVVRVIGARNQFLNFCEWLSNNDRSEDFLANDAHARLDVFDHGRRYEIACIARLRPTREITCAFLLAL